MKTCADAWRHLDLDAWTYLDLASCFVCAVTTLGRESLARRVCGDIVDLWLRVWAREVDRHDSQQELHSTLCILEQTPPGARPDFLATLGLPLDVTCSHGESFEDGIEWYISTFAESGAAAMVLVGSLSFAEGLSEGEVAEILGFYEGSADFLSSLSALLRFAQDVRFDPSEPMSAGVAAVAAERRIDILDVDVATLSVSELEPRLRAHWHSYVRSAHRRLNASVANHDDRAVRSRLSAVVDIAVSVAQQLASPSV